MTPVTAMDAQMYPPRLRSLLAAATLLSTVVIGACAMQGTREPQQTWITGWMSAPSFRPQKPRDNEMTVYSNQSVRQDVRIGLPADHLRLRLSNELGDELIHVGEVRIARVGPAGQLELPVTARFGGQVSVSLKAGEAVTSDSIALTAPAFADLAVSVYYPDTARPVTHRLMVRVANGSGLPGPDVSTVRGPALVSAVEVATDPTTAPAVIVAFGDSITEGSGSHTPHGDWPSRLAQRLDQACPGGFVVLNAGISGNHVLSDGGSPGALSRLDRDVLSVSGVSQVILMEGINDVRQADDSGNDGTAEHLIAADQQIVERLHARGIKVVGATLTPYEGTARQTPRGLAAVTQLNHFIRDGHLFDGVIDFYPALEDPAHPGRMRPELSSGDWLHPSDLGYATMIEAIQTGLFGPCKSHPH